MAEERVRERDLVLAPNEFAYVLDKTKGNINVYVGPHKASLSDTDQMVTFDEKIKKFQQCNFEKAVQTFVTAPEGWYILMKNPAKENEHPKTGSASNLIGLQIGQKINIHGPASFPLWPGQMTRVIQGHHLRSNQYLVVRVYDEEQAKQNWKKAVVKRQEIKHIGNNGALNEENQQNQSHDLEPPTHDLTIGKLIVIRGTEISFYMPPTGVEVVREENNNYVRNAVTLEQLEYCILLGENGQKTYHRGPDVVFPEPTESFLKGKDGSLKFMAYELNEISGLYIKVIAEYEDHIVGEELFITGKDEKSRIYFPRPEHALVTYDGQDKHHAIAIPAGEGRYVLDRQNGPITIKRGPAMFLPDPRREVIVRRVLDSKTVELYYPGNKEALEYNLKLKTLSEGKEFDFVTDQQVRSTLGRSSGTALRSSHIADDFSRGTEYTPPRTITLNTKFDGVPSINIWTGYAVQVASKSGKRRVVSGPESILLEYDETLEAMELSTGTPKNSDNKLKTVYLKVLGNKVSDKVTAETNDFCQVHITLSYRVNFERDSNKWFNVENYVKFLTEHARSLIRNAVKKHGIEEFYNESIAIVRDTVLGPSEDSKRPGRVFEENGMRIYDVEVLEVQIGDPTIAGLLKTTQHAVVKETFEMAAQRRKLEQTREVEKIEREITEEKTQTVIARIISEQSKIEKQLKLDQARVAADIQTLKEKLEKRLALEEGENKLHAEQLVRIKKTKEQELDFAEKELEQRIKELQAESDSIEQKIQAITPQLIAALQAFGDQELVARVAQSMAPLALLNGNSVADSLNTLVRGTPVEGLVKQLLSTKTNGEVKNLIE